MVDRPATPTPPTLPLSLLPRILTHLPTPTLYTCTLVCKTWRTLILTPGPKSQHLLKPHLPTLRACFGPDLVPARLPIPKVRHLLHLYAAQTLFGNFTTTTTYTTAELDSSVGLAVCGSLLAFVVGRCVKVLETWYTPMKLLDTIRVPGRAPVVAVTVNEAFVGVLDRTGGVHLFQLLARGSERYLCVRCYSADVGGVGEAWGLAMTPEGHGAPLVAVLGYGEWALVHPSHALVQRRGEFFRELTGGEKERVGDQGRRWQWVLTLSAPEGVRGGVTFSLRGWQMAVGGTGGYVGAGWGREDSRELARRRVGGFEDGVEVLGVRNGADELFDHYRGQVEGVRRWAVRSWELGWVDVLVCWDSFAIATEEATGAVAVVSLVPFEARCVLYRRTLAGRHHGYAVFEGEKVVNGKRVGGYIAFIPGEGRLKVLPLEGIGEWRGEEAGWELVRGCRDVPIGKGEVKSLFAGNGRVTVVFEDRVVVVRLWAVGSGGGEFCLARSGRVGKEWETAPRWRRRVEGCAVM